MNEQLPGHLIFEAADHQGNSRVFLVLPDRRKLPLPFNYRSEEFGLPGNMQSLAGGKLLAFYDDSTRTGAIYDGLGATPCWRLIQPTTRQIFFDHQVQEFVTYLKSEGLWPQGA